MASATKIIHRRKQRRSRRKTEKRQRSIWSALLIIFIFLAVVIPTGVILTGLAKAYAGIPDKLPKTPQDSLAIGPIIGPTQIYDLTGQTLLFSVEDPLGNQRQWLTLDDLPDYLEAATILWEDPDFFSTTQFSFIDVTDKIWSNWLNGPINPDTSLTGRLVHNVLLSLSDNPTVEERAQEITLIAEINRIYSPEEILEWHLNTNYYGHNAYGIDAAAQTYLGKSASDLTLDEAALLAAIATAPHFNPADDETAARGRQTDMLRRLLSSGNITQSQFEAAINIYTPIRPDAGQVPLIAPEFALYARQQAETILNTLGYDGANLITRGGLKITTTLDLDLYTQAQCMLETHLERLAGATTANATPCPAAIYHLPIINPVQGSLPDTGTIVILNIQTGEIMTMIGAGTRTEHQPGITLHPFVYLNGFINPNPNYTPASMLLDIPHSFPSSADGLIYIPQNPDGKYRGPVSLRDAMNIGLVAPVTQIANVLNLNNIIRDVIQTVGIDGLNNNLHDLSLLHKGGAVSVLNTTYAYSIFATLGQVNGLPTSPPIRNHINHVPVAVKQIEDAKGNVLWQYDEAQIAEARISFLQKEAAYLVNDILADNNSRQRILEQNNPLELSRPAAVINGITSDGVDNWTIGYTPYIAVGIHLGREDNAPLAFNAFGLEGAAPLWNGIMEYIHERENLPAVGWDRPEAIVETLVCDVSGMSPNDICQTHPEIFLNTGQIPPPDTYWQKVEINSQTGQLATANTPTELRISRAYFIPPQESMDWWQANNLPLPPTQWDTVSLPDIVSDAVILQPEHLDMVGGEVTINGSINTDRMDYYQLAYGKEINPSEWIAITNPIDTYIPGTPLGRWDTRTLDGTYTIQLLVVHHDQTRETASVHVIVDNIPPSAILTTDKSNYQWPDDTTISLNAEVSDNISINRVEFYHNGQFVGIDAEYPFGYEHTINRTGIEVFTAVIFDAVGNSSETQLEVEVTRSDG